MDTIAPLDPITARTVAMSGNGKKPVARKKSKKEVNAEVIEAEIDVDTKTTELAYQAGHGAMTAAAARVELAAWCKAKGYDKVSGSQLLNSKIKLDQQTRADEGNYANDDEKPRLLKEYELIKKRFGSDLRYNELFKQVEFQGEALELSLAKTIFTIHHRVNIKSAREDVSDISLMIAKENGYSPVREYLDDVSRRWGDDTTILNNPAARYLGGVKPLYDTCLMRWLISAVARAYKPGCKVDNVLILQGGQGLGKSSFFAILASRPWFDDSFGNSSDKDERLKIHRTWIVEWAEVETTFKRRDINAIKNFITTQTDVLRPPYGREPKPLDRPSVFCATTNQRELLADESGNRRFWVIPVAQKIPFKALEEDRDRIWAAAVSLYRQGVSWELTDSEKAEMREEQEQYAFTDTWYDDVMDFVEGKEFIAIADILEKRFNLTKLQQDQKTQFRVKRILSKAGWEPLPTQKYVEGVKKRVWRNPSFSNI